MYFDEFSKIILALRTVVSASAAESNFLDRGLANSTWLFRAVVNPRHTAIIAVGALDIEIIAKGSTTLIDRELENFDDRLS